MKYDMLEATKPFRNTPFEMTHMRDDNQVEAMVLAERDNQVLFRARVGYYEKTIMVSSDYFWRRYA